MPERDYYAHIAQDGRTQTVLEHLQGTAQRASACLVGIGLEKAAYLAGLLHDLGKFTDAFQSYIKEGDRSKRGSVIHTFQGCRYILELSSTERDQDPFISAYTAELLAFAVGAHHGLFDCVDETGKSGMLYRKEKENTYFQNSVAGLLNQGITIESIMELFDQASEEVNHVLLKIEENYLKDEEYCFEIGLLARLLLSAVIDGDRYDTAAFMNGISNPEYREDLRPIWKSRLDFMEAKLEQFPKDTAVERARRTISDRCRAFAAKPKGVYRLNVPTGAGKTLSSLRYALAHAEAWNQKRLIFVSPLLSILEQNAAVIHSFIGDDSLILEHHSNVVQAEQTQEQLDERELLIQNWESPIIITTLVQLLNCMFDGKTTSIRRFQALCNSVIIIDEVQTVPTRLLSLFNLTIRFLAEQCETTVVLCSATQPCLEELDHPLLPVPEDMVPYDPVIWGTFARTKLVPTDSCRLEQLPVRIRFWMENTKSLLVVCNKKDEAAFLLEHTRSAGYTSFHLSASMCMQHRRDTVSALRASLGREKTLCISTQVIEAGVDISFQQVLRLAAGMDSVVQSAGRCNRNGESSTPCPVYLVNCADETLGKLQDIQRGKTATIALLNAFNQSGDRFQDDLASDSAIAYYYKAFYSDMEQNAQDYPLPKMRTTLLDLISENTKFTAIGGMKLEKCLLRQAFKTAGQAFSVFDEDTVDVLVPYRAGKQLITQLSSPRCLRDVEYRSTLLKRAASYTVTLYAYQRKRLEEIGALYTICDGSVLVLQPEYYDMQTGVKTGEQNLAFLEV